MDPSLADRREEVAWALVGAAITVLVGFVMYSFFGALVVGVFLYYAVRPVYDWFNKWTDHPDVAATVTLLLVGLPMFLVLAYATFVGIREIDQFLRAANLEEFRTALAPYVDIVASSETRGVVGFLRNNVSRLTGLATAAFTWSLRLFVIVTVAFYLLRDDQKIARWYRQTFENSPTAITFMEEVDDELTTIYTGNLITIGITGLIAVVVFYALDAVAPNGTGIPFPLLLGLLVGVATLVPAVGMKLVYFPYTGYLLWQSFTTQTTPLWFPVVFFVVTLVVVDTFPDLFIRSYVSKGGLNMGLVLLTYVLGAIAFGWYGVFFGPIVLVLFVKFYRMLFPALIADRRATG